MSQPCDPGIVTPRQREDIRRAYHSQCGYCGVHEDDVGSVLEIDHFQPISQGGTDDTDNLVYSCTAYNKLKGDFWAPTSTEKRLLHPQRDVLAEHIQLSLDDLYQPLTPTAAWHMRRLRLNWPQLVALRQSRRRALDHKTRQTELGAHVTAMRHELVLLESQAEAVLEQTKRLLDQMERIRRLLDQDD